MTTETWLNTISNTLDGLASDVALYNQQTAFQLEILNSRFETFTLYFEVLMLIFIAYIVHHIFDAIWKR